MLGDEQDDVLKVKRTTDSFLYCHFPAIYSLGVLRTKNGVDSDFYFLRGTTNGIWQPPRVVSNTRHKARGVIAIEKALRHNSVR